MPRPKKIKPPDPDLEIFRLYDGQVELRFKKSSHRTVIDDNGQRVKPPSVTTVLGILNKPAIIPWAVNKTADFIHDGFKDLTAGNSFSIDAVFKLIEQSRRASEAAREEAAEIGTDAHDFLAAYLRGMSSGVCPQMPEDGPVRNCINAALDWITQHDVRPTIIEYPLYSRKFQITGRPDFIGLIDGEFSVLDFKSTKCLWPEVPLQMAPYAKMYDEEYGQLPTVRWGLRMDKISGEFEDKKYLPADLDVDFDTFMCCFKIYDRLKHLRRKPRAEDIMEELG
jgi:hypothetical protein